MRRVVITAISALVAGCLDPAPPPPPWTPGEATLLSTGSPTKDEDPTIVLAKDGTIIVAWFSDRGANPDIYVTSTKNGSDWTAPVRVTTHSGGDFYPNLVQDDAGLFHLTWFRWTAPYEGHIIYNTSPDGVTWSTANELLATKAPNVDDGVPTMTVKPDGTVLIYFVSKRRNTTSPQNDLYLARKEPGNADFDAVVGATGVNLPTAHEHLPFISRTGPNYTLVWVRYDLPTEIPWESPKSDLYYATSQDGVSWSSPAPISTDAGNVKHLFPTFYQTQGNAWYLLWLSTRTGVPELFETPVSNLTQYPTGVAELELPVGYSHRIVPTSAAGTFVAVWVVAFGGSAPTSDVYYRILRH